MKVVFNSDRVIEYLVPDDTVVKAGRSVPFVETEQPSLNAEIDYAHPVSPIGQTVPPEAETFEQQWFILPKPQADVWTAKVAEGYFDETTNITLKTTPEAQSLFTSKVIWVREAVHAGVLNGQSEVYVYDHLDERKVLTVDDFRALMVRYGAHCDELFDLYAP